MNNSFYTRQINQGHYYLLIIRILSISTELHVTLVYNISKLIFGFFILFPLYLHVLDPKRSELQLNPIY